MPIEPPRLDDLRYDAVVEDLVRRIPVYAPVWTDHNDSDPGITLIQLFAHLAEQIGYRLDRVPELAHLALLELLGIRLQPAGAAQTQLALLFADPAKASASVVPAGAVARAAQGDPPPVFTTDRDHDLVPADVRHVLSTRNPFLQDVLLLPDGTRETVTTFPDTPADDTPWLSVRWDGRSPKPADLPAQPVPLVGDATHDYVWLALGFNGAPDAGFRGVPVALRLQLDDTEQPTLAAHGPCEPAAIVGEVPDVVDWLHYWDAEQDAMLPVPGRIEDETDDLSRSGTVGFTVPEAIGPIPDDAWTPMQAASTVDALDAAAAFSAELGEALGDASVLEDVAAEIAKLFEAHFNTAIDDAWQAMPVPPPLVALLGDVQQDILDRIAATWSLPDLTDVRDHVVAEITDAIDTLTWQGDIQPLFDALRELFLAPIEALLDPMDFLDVFDALGRVGSVIAGIDLNASADQLHTATRDWVLGQLAGLGPITIPPPLGQALADSYAERAVGAVDHVFGSAPGGTHVAAIADHYRYAARDAIEEAAAHPPTTAVARLAETYADALEAANAALDAVASQITEFVDHPLPPRYRDETRIQGWLRLTVPAGWGTASPQLRHAGFNVVPATNAETAGRLVVGAGDGRPGLELRLPHQNILPGTLELGVQESADPAEPLVPWQEVDDLAAAGPLDRVFALDREAGELDFGTGSAGRIPPLVPSAGSIVAEGYRHGGGEAANVAVGAVTKLETPVPGVTGVVNIVAAAGGRDAETLDEAKLRARRDLATRHRAVTAADFEWIATQTPEVNVGRAVTLGLRRPIPTDTATGAPPAARCGPPLPDGPTGIEDGLVAHGVVSVVAVPDEAGPEPLPTASFLAAVCRWLDLHRLVTTELYVIPPQYVRLCDLRLTVQPAPGYSRVQLQERVTADLADHLHVLTGGDDGTGFPFASQLHVADLIARVARVEGVDRVEELRCGFTRTKSGAVPRQGELVLCPAAPDEHEAVVMGGEETVSFDAASVLLTTVAPT
jgi:hypothetical protein